MRHLLRLPSAFRALSMSLLLLWWVALPSVLYAETRARPYILWTARDIDEMRERLESDAEYAARVEYTLENPAPRERDFLALWRWAVLEDAEAGEQQKEKLLRVARSAVPRGAAQWLTVLRYDLLYHELSDEERDLVEAFFREYIDHAIFRNSIFNPAIFNDERNYSRYHAHYHRINNWLPNITFPRVLSANLMAAALGDEGLLRQAWDHYGSWRWYFDDYLTDGGFYGEETGKQHATVGEMLLYCIAVDNLGFNELGFGYRGRHGATMRGHVEVMLRQAYPLVRLHSDYPHIPRLTSGDLRGAPRDMERLQAFQPGLVHGFLSGGEGTRSRWSEHGAWGGEIRGSHPQWDGYHGFTPKMEIPYWFEISHQRWPEAGFGYFLPFMREYGDDIYKPSIYFSLPPIAHGDVAPPRAPSWVAERRGLAMLRADESPEYWTGSAPALGMRLATPYAHDVFDNFALNGLYAFNRPIFINRHIGGYARRWARSVLSHAGVLVDGHEPAFTDLTSVRSHFQSPMSFLSARSLSLYPDISASRGVFLAREYLVDIFALADQFGNPRNFRWTVHPLGLAVLDEDIWSQPQPLTGEWGADEQDRATATSHRLLEGPQDVLNTFGSMRRKEVDQGWHLRVVQRSLVPEEQRLLPPGWYGREIGLDMRMLGATNTRVAVGPTPLAFDPEDAPTIEDNPQAHEVGGTSILVHRRAARTVFAVLHEPFEGGAGGIHTLRQVAETGVAIGLAIGGKDEAVHDWVFYQYHHDGSTVTMQDVAGMLDIRFRDHAWIRMHADRVEIFGDVQSIRLPAPAGSDTRYYHNKRLSPAQIDQGFLEYTARH